MRAQGSVARFGEASPELAANVERAAAGNAQGNRSNKGTTAEATRLVVRFHPVVRMAFLGSWVFEVGS